MQVATARSKPRPTGLLTTLGCAASAWACRANPDSPESGFSRPALQTLLSGNQVDDGDEQRGADDRPEHGERVAADPEHERLGQVELGGDPGTDERSDE